MNFYMIVGPQAVGKMTVGQTLAKKTGAKLFHNHMTIDLVDCFFDYGTPQGNRLVKEYRRLLFEEVMNSDVYPGFIFTYVCDFDSDDGLEYIYNTCEAFEACNHKSYIIELNAGYEIRKERNVTENRRIYKKMKRNIAQSIEVFERFEKVLRTQSNEDEIRWPRYLRIDNTSLTPDEVANLIMAYCKEH